MQQGGAAAFDSSLNLESLLHFVLFTIDAFRVLT